MIIKPREHHREYLTVLERLGPEGRVKKAFELSAFSKQLFMEGLRKRFREKSEREIINLYIKIQIQKSEKEKTIELKCRPAR